MSLLQRINGPADLKRLTLVQLPVLAEFIEQGPQDLLRLQYGLTADGIYEEAKALLTEAGISDLRRR